MTSVALVTAREAISVDDDLAPLLSALQNLGIDASTECWDDPAVRWQTYRLALLRSTWDYAYHYETFLHWLDDTSRLVTLLNPPSTVRWNTDKHYLKDLQAGGLPVVPSVFFEPSEPLPAHIKGLGSAIVVKPAVGAGGKDVGSYSSVTNALRHVELLLRQGRACLAQPYLPSIDADGETGLVYIDGKFSHAFRKAALLRLNTIPSTDLFIPEDIGARTATSEERSIADAAVHRFARDLLYARVDLVRNHKGNPAILELELSEPGLFVAQDPTSADRFARAVQRRLATSAPIRAPA